VPCYNEAERLKTRTFEEFFAANEDINWIFVNDGSTDSALGMLEALAKRHPLKIVVFDLQPNQGKAEAVRQGLLQAYQNGKDELIGFWDEDLATPLETILEMVDVLRQNQDIEMVLARG
jgi:dolichyl-phosphate beta-glucosyltransferase